MREEIIIDIKELCHRVLKNWKMLVLFSIVGICVINLLGYVMSYRDYKNGQPVDEATIEEYRSKLSEKELEAAEQAFDTYEVYKNQYQSELEYSKNSILMKLGTNNVATVEMQYYIDNHYKSVYPIIEQTNNVTDIIEAYSLQLSSGDVMDQIKETTGTDIEGRYLRELISVEPVEDSQTMKITISTDSKELTDGIADVIEQEIDSFTQTIQEQYGEFDIVGANRYETTEVDDSVFELQQEKITLITTLKSQIDMAGNNLNAEQKKYYNAMINNTESTKDSFQEKIVDLKNTLMGAVGGIILVICGIFLKYILQEELRNQNDIKNIYDNYTLGIVNNTDEKIDIVVDQIVALATKKGADRIALVSTVISQDTQKICNIIRSKIEKYNLEMCTACGIDNIPNLLKDVGDKDLVIMIEKKNDSTYKNIEREIEMCKKCNVEILGNIVIDTE